MDDSSENGSSSNNNAGTSWFGQAKEWLAFNMDNARIERLHQCRVLQETLAACRKNVKLKQVNADRLQLEDSSPGIRMVNYFKWRQENDYHATCQREEHALWACRAVALQCGNDLMRMRECFNELQGVGLDGKPDDVGAILKHKRTAYGKEQQQQHQKEQSH
jgi:hypothetical protein